MFTRCPSWVYIAVPRTNLWEVLQLTETWFESPSSVTNTALWALRLLTPNPRTIQSQRPQEWVRQLLLNALWLILCLCVCPHRTPSCWGSPSSHISASVRRANFPCSGHLIVVRKTRPFVRMKGLSDGWEAVMGSCWKKAAAEWVQTATGAHDNCIWKLTWIQIF